MLRLHYSAEIYFLPSIFVSGRPLRWDEPEMTCCRHIYRGGALPLKKLRHWIIARMLFGRPFEKPAYNEHYISVIEKKKKIAGRLRTRSIKPIWATCHFPAHVWKKKRRQSLWVITRWPSQNTWSRAIFCRMSSLFRLRHLIFPLSHVLPPCGRAEKRALEGPALERRDMVDMPLCNVEKRKRCCYFCVYNNEKSDRQCFMTHAGCLHEPWDCKGAGNAKKYGLVRATRSTIGDNVAATHGR